VTVKGNAGIFIWQRPESFCPRSSLVVHDSEHPGHRQQPMLMMRSCCRLL
jgi:hypothetical protein